MNAEQTKAEEARSLARREFVWSIRTQRLCAAAVKRYAKPNISREEAARTSKAEAARYIARAEQWAGEQISESQRRGEITEGEAREARQELAEIVKETKKQADGLPK